MSALQEAQRALEARGREVDNLNGHLRRVERSNQTLGEENNHLKLQLAELTRCPHGIASSVRCSICSRAEAL